MRSLLTKREAIFSFDGATAEVNRCIETETAIKVAATTAIFLPYLRNRFTAKTNTKRTAATKEKVTSERVDPTTTSDDEHQPTPKANVKTRTPAFKAQAFISPYLRNHSERSAVDCDNERLYRRSRSIRSKRQATSDQIVVKLLL